MVSFSTANTNVAKLETRRGQEMQLVWNLFDDFQRKGLLSDCCQTVSHISYRIDHGTTKVFTAGLSEESFNVKEKKIQGQGVRWHQRFSSQNDQ